MVDRIATGVAERVSRADFSSPPERPFWAPPARHIPIPHRWADGIFVRSSAAASPGGCRVPAVTLGTHLIYTGINAPVLLRRMSPRVGRW